MFCHSPKNPNFLPKNSKIIAEIEVGPTGPNVNSGGAQRAGPQLTRTALHIGDRRRVILGGIHNQR